MVNVSSLLKCDPIFCKYTLTVHSKEKTKTNEVVSHSETYHSFNLLVVQISEQSLKCRLVFSVSGKRLVLRINFLITMW